MSGQGEASPVRLSCPHNRLLIKPGPGKTASERLAVRKTRSAPLVAELKAWMQAERAELSRANDLAKAMDDMLKRCVAFGRVLEDGRSCLVKNAAERAMRPIAASARAGCRGQRPSGRRCSV
jgi:hypothetical protein